MSDIKTASRNLEDPKFSLGRALCGPQRLSYRKLLVFVTSTMLYLGGMLSEDNWKEIAMLFFFSDVVAGIAREKYAQQIAVLK